MPRLTNVNVKNVWMQLRADPEFMIYFGDHNYKKAPPSEYFWRVVEQMYPERYTQLLNENRNRLDALQQRFRTLNLTQEAIEILDNFNPQELQLMLKANTHTLQRPATLLRPTMRRNTRQQVQFLQNQPQTNQANLNQPPQQGENNQNNQGPNQARIEEEPNRNRQLEEQNQNPDDQANPDQQRLDRYFQQRNN